MTITKTFDQQMADWWRKNDPGSAEGMGWAAPAFDASAWKSMALPQNWEKVAGLENFDGLMWFRREADLAADWAGKDLTLELGPIDDRDFPFLIVQLANFMAVQTTPVQSGWAELREAQLLTAQNVPGAGLAVIIDIGDANDIHPKNKQDVGRRLALAALARALR